MQEYFNEHTDRFYRRLRLLLTGRLRGEQGTPEREELDQWIAMSEANADLFRQLTDEGQFDHHIRFLYELDEEQAWRRLRRRAGFEQQPVPLRPGLPVSLFRRLAIAAMFLLFAGSIYLLAGRSITGKSLSSPQAHGIFPVSFPDTIITHNRERRRLTLDDGTIIWLNNATTIILLQPFNARTREVRLRGEAFFEVAKDAARPFRVFFQNDTIEVLGTSFNVRAYPGSGTQSTTLIHGSLRVSNDIGTSTLRPGEQALARDGEALATRKVSGAAAAGSWRNGYVRFRDASLREVMDEVERWFSVRVVLRSRIDVHLNVTLDQSMGLEEFMRIIQTITQAEIRIRGGVVEVAG